MNSYDIERSIEAVRSRHSDAYYDAISDLVVAMARQDLGAELRARTRLEAVVTETMGIAECVGALSLLQSAASVVVQEPAMFARFAGDIRSLIVFRGGVTLASVTFREALAELISRTPAVIRSAAERTAQRISELYSKGRVIAFARSAERAVTERVQALMVEAMREGISEAYAGKLITWTANDIRKRTSAWTDGYSRMAFRVNVNTAVTAGRFRQAQDQDVRKVIPCFRFDATGDSDTRDNHRAADGLIFRSTNPIWNTIAPPIGYNCRCNVSLITTPMLQRMGRITANGDIIEDRLPAGAFPDPGFRHGGRPDLFVGAG